MLGSRIDIGQWIGGALSVLAVLAGADASAASVYTDISAYADNGGDVGERFPIYGSADPLFSRSLSGVGTYLFPSDSEGILVLYNNSSAEQTLELDVSFASTDSSIEWYVSGDCEGAAKLRV